MVKTVVKTLQWLFFLLTLNYRLNRHTSHLLSNIINQTGMRFWDAHNLTGGVSQLTIVILSVESLKPQISSLTVINSLGK